MSSRRCIALVLMIIIGLMGWAAAATAHRSGCHHWHSCPSDHGTYVCGDLGYCAQCPDNEYCQGGQPRSAAKAPAKPAKPGKPLPSQPPLVKVARVIDGDTL
jgi:hypothetical protein